MLRKPLLSVMVAVAALLLLALAVSAQALDEEEMPTVEPLVADVQQTVPVTLTVVIPSPTGPITLEVPIYLTLDIRIGISSELTASVVATPSVALTDTVPLATATPEEEEEAATLPATATPAPTATPVPPTATPTAAAAVPTATPLPVLPTPTPADEVEPVPVAAACEDPRALITAPIAGQVVAGPAVAILGTATHENFSYFKLEIAPGANADSAFEFLGDVRVAVTQGVLGSLDSTTYANGIYTLRLTVVDNTGNFPPPCAVNIVIEN